MSGRLVSAVFESALPAWLKPYAAICASFAAEDGSRVFPTVATVASMAGRSIRAAQTALEALRQRGILESQARHGRAITYRFIAAALPASRDQLPLFPQTFPQATSRKPERSTRFPQDAQVRSEVDFRSDLKWASPDPSQIPQLRTHYFARARDKATGKRQNTGTR